MHTRLTIPEQLKDLRVAEKRMSLQELSDATGIPSSTLGNYEKDENVDISLGNLLTLADFYHASTDYLLCRTELREHTNKSVSDLHLNDDAVQILTDEKYNPRLLSELLSHKYFHKFMTDLEIYIDGLLLQLSLLQRILPKPLMMLILTDYSFCSAKIWK